MDVDNITIDQAAVKSATCKIVSINWLEEVVANEKAVAEKAYLLDAGGAADAADGDDAAADTQSNGKRPTRKAATKAADKTADDATSQDANGDDQKPVKKVAKKAAKSDAKPAAAAKTDKKRAIKDEDEDDDGDADAKPTKKQKNSQKASSKTLSIPVDENFIYERPDFQSKRPETYPCYQHCRTNISPKTLRSTLQNQA